MDAVGKVFFFSLPAPWFHGFAAGVWPEYLPGAYTVPRSPKLMVMLHLSVLCACLLVVYWLWASARLAHLGGYFTSRVPQSVYDGGGWRSSVEAWCTTTADF